jgi:SAM-dependent methyltransferase
VSTAIWHDIECGAYTADLPLWEELAAGATVLDVGAGTGRVALRLAQAGCAVTALDVDAGLLAVLTARARADGLDIQTVVADAAEFELDARFALVAVPMQTIQLLSDAAARAGFFASARRVLAPGGLVALAIAAELETFEGDFLPPPDVGESDGMRYESQPTAVRAVPGGTRIERLRRVIVGGHQITEQDVVVLASVSAESLAAEAAAVGLRLEAVRWIDPTPEHVGSEVVLLRG